MGIEDSRLWGAMNAKLDRGLMLLSLSVLFLFNFLPYLSRLHEGKDWIRPDGHGIVFFLGLVFFHVLYSMPVIPFVRTLIRLQRPTLIWAIVLGLVSAFMFFMWQDVELCCDPNAAVVLVDIPLISMGVAFGLLALGHKFYPPSLLDQPAGQDLKAALRKAEDSPGWLGNKKHW